MALETIEQYGGSNHERDNRTACTTLHQQRRDLAKLLHVIMPKEDSPEEWMEDAVCATTDPELFFPEKGGSTKEAKRICAGCEVREECLAFALKNDEKFGVWGGLTERQRRKLTVDGSNTHQSNRSEAA